VAEQLGDILKRMGINPADGMTDGAELQETKHCRFCPSVISSGTHCPICSALNAGGIGVYWLSLMGSLRPNQQDVYNRRRQDVVSGSWVILSGVVNAGKSVLATRFAYAAIASHWNEYRHSFAYIPYREFSEDYRTAGINLTDILGRILSHRLLFLDDIGREQRRSGQDSGRILSLLTDRAEREGIQMIITTNLSNSEIVSWYGADALRRIENGGGKGCVQEKLE